MSADRPLAHRPRRAVRIAATCTTAALALLLSAAGAQAKSPRTVAPELMKPTLNPAFAPWTCWEAGSGITCQGVNQIAYDEAFGLQCEGRAVYISGSGSARMTRWHTADGKATKTSIHSGYVRDVFSLSPTADGPTFTVSAHYNSHYVYAVPGDPASRTLTEVGAILLGRAGGGGPLLIHDSGVVTFVPGRDAEVAVQHGVHDFYDDPSILDRAICEALT